jgi:hypothetical protein
MTREEAKQLLPLLQAYAEGKTIQIKTDNGWEDLEKDELPIEDMAEFPEEYRLKNKQNEPKSHYYYYVVTTSDNSRLCGCIGSVDEGFPLSTVREYIGKTRSLDKDKLFVSFFAEVSKEEFEKY